MRALPLALACFVCLCGCPGSIDDVGLYTGDSPDFCIHVVERALERTCATSQCHSAAVAEANLDLETTPIGPRLVGQATDDPDCGELLIDPDDVAASVMFTKVTRDYRCGSRMPVFARPFTQTQMDCMLEWIARQLEE